MKGRYRVKVSVSDKGPGFGVLAAELAGAEIRIGVQDEDAAKKHPTRGVTIGELAARHEMGLGMPERSFLRSWFDQNRDRTVRELASAEQQIIKGGSRKKIFERLGFIWTDEIRRNIASGKVRPVLKASTIRRKGHDTPLLETATLVNNVKFKLFLAQAKSIKDPKQREAVRSKGKK